jgi:hypothetical protein
MYGKDEVRDKAMVEEWDKVSVVIAEQNQMYGKDEVRDKALVVE